MITPVFSSRIILGFIIGMMGFLALTMALLSGSIHRDLVFDNQRDMIEEMIRVETKERIKDLNGTSHDLGLALQSSPAFQAALNAGDLTALVSLLDNQFHQYFVTAGVIKLEKLILFDKKFSMLVESAEGLISFSQHQRTFCPQLLDRARLRTGSQRIKILYDLCLYDNRPISVAVVPVGGLRLKGYIMVVTDPTHNLMALESNLGMPLKLKLINKETVFQSQKWPARKIDSLLSGYELKTSTGLPVLSILTAWNISELSEFLHQTRLDFFLIFGIGTLIIVALSIFILRNTMLSPLGRLTDKLRSLHTDQSRMGDQLEVTGAKEIHEIIEGFNEMSLKLKNLYQSLQYMAFTDSLTELPNRNQFQKTLESFIQLQRQINKPFALFLIDLDRFKGVNDTLGHHVGDELLKAVSLRLRSILRDDDIVSQLDQESIARFNENMVARLGGDEFSAILTSIHTLEDSLIVARKLVQAMEQPFKVNEHQLTIGLSIGIAMYPEHGDDMHALVSHADIAMYDAKSRSCGFSIYDSSKNKLSVHGLRLEQDLFASIKKNELVLYYQPKISVLDGNVIGAEALIRWQHPEHGLIPPDEFIPMAEQTGLIQPLTEWVLNKALENCSKDVYAEESLSVSVNLSALNLRDERISSTIINALEKWSVPPEILTLELTESTIMSDPEFAIEILTKLDAMGVSLSIDDFGTGHSSLAYVKKLPVDEIKIDKSFIKDITQDNDNEAIVRAVLVLAHRMQLSVVAEGVEDIKTLNLLRDLGCDIVQGYYFAKPMPFEEYIAWLEQNRNRKAS
jgi:diguanylate cyclase (GGDEF)-like protein